MRVGRKYQPLRGQKPGLFFMCLNGDIERQFEFVQQTWIRGNVISLSCPITISGERDPLLGSSEPGNTGFSIPTPDGPLKLNPMQSFVTTRGGGYFFLPGQRLIRYLSADGRDPPSEHGAPTEQPVRQANGRTGRRAPRSEKGKSLSA